MSARPRLGAKASRLCLVLLAVGACLVLEPAAARTAPPVDPEAISSPALRLDAGSIARNRLVALGRDLAIDGEAHNHAVAIGGSVRVSGRVDGDVIVLGGDATLAPTARVTGDVFVLGGRIEAASGAQIGGRSVAYPDAAKAWLSLLEGPSLGAKPMVVVGAKLALLAFWALLISLLFAIGGRGIVSTSRSVREEPLRNFAIGLTGVLAMAMTAVAASALAGAIVGLPLLALLVVIALLLRFWGMVAVFHALGAWLLEGRVPAGSRVVPVTAACAGLIVLGVLKLVPWLGVWCWMLSTFIGVGAALSTKLGRREPWLTPP